METVGDRINQLLKALNIKKVDFAKELDRSTGNVSDWINNKCKPGKRSLTLMHEIYGISIKWLIDGIGDMFECTENIDPESNQMENIDFLGFGERLKTALKNANYTQLKVTEELGLSKNDITNYVNGRIPDATILYKISKILGVSMEWLLTGENILSFEKSLDKEEYELLNLYSSCSNGNKKDILDSIKAYLASPNYDFKKSSESLNEEELNILKLYRNLTTRDKIKIEGIIESKLLEIDESKKGKSSTYQNGEVEASERKNA